MALLDWAMPIGQLAATGINAWQTAEANKQNLALQQEEWKREDSSYQRKVADLKAAGLNPALALGGGSPSSLAVRVAAPQVEAPDMSAPLRMNLVRQQTAVSDAEARIKKAEAATAEAKSRFDVAYWSGLEKFAPQLGIDELRVRGTKANTYDSTILREAEAKADSAVIQALADKFGYESLTSFGDAGSFLNNVFKVAQILGGFSQAYKGIR